MESSTVVESPDFPGFYEIPGFSKYVISRAGEVINKQTKARLSGTCLDGYHLFSLTNDEGCYQGIGRHRLLGLAFKHPGVSVEKLVINHLNGIPGSDDLRNLEWTTYKGNIEHAGMMGLTTKCIPISVRDIQTGEVNDYPSIAEYARLIGCTKDKINWRVRIGETRVFPEGKQYRRAGIKTPWYDPPCVNKALLFNTRSRKTLVRHLLTGEIKEFHSLSEAARHLDVSKAAVSIWISSGKQPVLPGFVQIKFAHDDTPWREVADPYLEYELDSGIRPVKIVEVATRKETIFLKARECCLAKGLKLTTLYFRLKSKGEKVYSDGCTYAYYSDVI